MHWDSLPSPRCRFSFVLCACALCVSVCIESLDEALTDAYDSWKMFAILEDSWGFCGAGFWRILPQCLDSPWISFDDCQRLCGNLADGIGIRHLSALSADSRRIAEDRELVWPFFEPPKWGMPNKLVVRHYLNRYLGCCLGVTLSVSGDQVSATKTKTFNCSPTAILAFHDAWPPVSYKLTIHLVDLKVKCRTKPCIRPYCYWFPVAFVTSDGAVDSVADSNFLLFYKSTLLHA